jgi:hypothetical protein
MSNLSKCMTADIKEYQKEMAKDVAAYEAKGMTNAEAWDAAINDQLVDLYAQKQKIIDSVVTAYEKVKPKPEPVVEPAPVQAPVIEQKTALPKLDVFTLKSVGEVAYQARNLVADFFEQSGERIDAASQKPLTQMKDFLSAWLKDYDLVKQFLPQGKLLSEKHHDALHHMQKQILAWNTKLAENFTVSKEKNEFFKLQDMMQYLQTANEDGSASVEENIKTAMSYAAYQYTLTQAGAPSKTKADINKMFGRQKEASIPASGYNVLRRFTSHEDTLISQLGNTAIQALGLKALANAPKDLMPRLENALGTHILAMLEREEVIKREHFSLNQIAGFLGTEEQEFDGEADPNVIVLKNGEVKDRMTTLISFNKSEDFKLVNDLREANKDTAGIVDKVFGTENAVRFASTKPVKFVQKLAKGTKQQISKLQTKVLEAMGKIPHTANKDIVILAEDYLLGREGILRIAGHQDTASGDHHIDNIDAIEAQNENLAKQFDLAIEMLSDPSNEEGWDTKFYILGEVWRNFRAGIVTQSLNPQTSKIHRFFFSRPKWKATLDLSNKDMMEEFEVCFAQAIGISIDKQHNWKTREKLKTELEKNPEIMEAVRALMDRSQKVGDVNWDEATKENLIKVCADREGMMTLQALVAYAKVEQAKLDTKGQGKIEIEMLVGADGKTSGPMLTHLALGAADEADTLYDTINRGGMYSTDEGQAKHYSDYAVRDNAEDLYQNLGRKNLETVKEYTKTEVEIQKAFENGDKNAKHYFTGVSWAAFEKLTGDLLSKDNRVTSALRNLTKTPLTAFGFGSALKSAVRGMENAFIDSLSTKLTGIKQGKTPLTLKEYAESINALIALGNPDLKPIPNMDIDQWLNSSWDTPNNKKYEKALRDAFQKVMGTPVKISMGNYFKTFIDRRGKLNKTIQASFAGYHAIYLAARQKEIDRLVSTGEIKSRPTKDGKLAPLHDMTQPQEDAFHATLKDISPVMHNYYSAQEQNLDAGLYMAGEEKISLSSARTVNRFHESKVWLRNRTKNNTNYSMDFMTSTSNIYQETDVGVAGVPYIIHSDDSAIMHTALSEYQEALNIHDEISINPNDIAKAAEAINRATVQVMLHYSPTAEAAAMFNRIVINAAKQLEEGKLDHDTVKAMFSSWAKVLNWGTFDDKNKVSPADAGLTLLMNTHDNAVQADKVRLGALAKLAVMDQYPWEGGQHNVPDSVRQEAAKKLAELNPAVDPAAEAAMEKLTEFFKQDPKTVPVQELKQEPSDELDPPVKGNYWGKVGTPKVAPNLVLQQFFESTPNPTAKQVIEVLQAQLASFSRKEMTSWGRFQGMLLERLGNLVDPNLPIHYIKPNTPESIAPHGKVDGAMGWYAGDGSAIFVLSPEFENSGLNGKLITHELTHAVLAALIAQARAGKSPKAMEFVKSLEALQKEAIAFAATQYGIADKYKHALSDLHEFLAYGLTSSAFQREVLNKLRVQENGSLITGLKGFVKNIVGYFFKGLPETELDMAGRGMVDFMLDVEGLFKIMAKQKPEAKAETKNLAAMAANGLMDYSTVDLFKGIANAANPTSVVFAEHLEGLLSTIVEKVHGAAGSFKAGLMNQQAGTAIDVWAKALVTGVAPFAADSIASGFPCNDQEAFVMEQIEASVKALLSSSEAPARAAYANLAKLYKEAKERMTPQDFNVDPVIGQQLYDFVFKPTSNADGTSDYLARFAALGLGNSKVNSLLQFNTSMKTGIKPKSFAERLKSWFENAMSFFQDKVTHTYAGQRADEKLEILVRQLVDIEAKRKHQLHIQKTKTPFLEPIGNVVDDLANTAKQGVATFANMPIFRNASSGIVRGSATLIHSVATDRVEKLMEGLKTLHAKTTQERHSFIRSSLAELTGPVKAFTAALRQTKHNEQTRKDLISANAKFALQAFADGKDMNDDTKKSLSLLLRTGAHNLLDQNINMVELETLISDPAALYQKILDLEAKLTGPDGLKWLYQEQINGLAYQQHTGINRIPFLLLNASNISKMLGTKYAPKISPAIAKANEPIIASLIALRGLKYSSKADRNDIAQVLRKENARGNGEHGVQFMLTLHKKLEQESAAKLFNGSPALMMHGYMPEIYNPYVDVKVVTSTDGMLLEEQGYKMIHKVVKDKNDPGDDKFLYVRNGVGMMPYLSAAISLTGLSSKGSVKHSGVLHPSTAAGQMNTMINRKLMNEKMAVIDGFGKRDANRDLSQEDTTHMVPVLNDRGETVNWRYMMATNTKDVYLQRTNQFDQLIGALAGSVYDKQTAPEHNKQVIQAMYDQYKLDYALNPEQYIVISPSSNDPQFREMWRLMPDKAKADARRIWGSDSMYVRADSMDILFGYRKFSLTDMFAKDPDARNALESLLTGFAHFAMGNMAELRVAQVERGWQELVKEIKDTLVVKSFTTLTGNFRSNLTYLVLAGVPLRDILNSHLVALRGATAYRKDHAELLQLQTETDLSYNQAQDTARQDRIVELQDALQRNPVRALIEEGLMPTIVEDVEQDDNPYSYKSHLVGEVDKLTSGLNKHVKAVGETIYMAHKTPLYRGLSQMTQLSDFLARYTLYQHETTRQKNPVDHKQAVQNASDAFINYDIAMHRGLQYSDDMGLTMFTKYYLRIQRVLLRLGKDHPARVLAMLAFDAYQDVGPMVLDGSAISKFGNNPFESGAFGIFTTADDLATVKAGMALIKGMTPATE